MEEKLVAGTDYRVLSLLPQWAWAVMNGGKTVEYRTWATSYRGRMLIHASSKQVPESQLADLREEMAAEFAVPLALVPEQFEAKAILGSVDLVDCIEQRSGDVDWLLRDVRPLQVPIRGVNGKLKVWHWTPEPLHLQGVTGAAASTSARAPATSTRKNESGAATTGHTASADNLDANAVMASFRSVATAHGAPEKDFLREASRTLGFARMGARVEEALKAQLRTAVKRKIVLREGKVVRSATHKCQDYDMDTLVSVLGSLVRRGKAVERTELSTILLRQLGFGEADNTNDRVALAALDAAVAKRVLVADGSRLRRVG